MARGRLSLLLPAGLLLALTLVAPAAPSFPPLTGRVVDQAGLLDPSAATRIEGKLADLEAKTTTQLVLVTLRSLQDHDIADYGYQLGRHWGIGQRGSNNGALLIVAPNERKVRIEVGYGLEGTLTDAVSQLIIANAILPRFRSGDFAGGIERGIDDLVQVLSGDAEDFKRRAAEQRRGPAVQFDPAAVAFVVVVLGFWLFIFIRQSRRQSLRGRGRGRRSSGFWESLGGALASGGSGGRSGGWGGGSGGGFSGGGGSFGGGGSSGSW